MTETDRFVLWYVEITFTFYRWGSIQISPLDQQMAWIRVGKTDAYTNKDEGNW